MKLAFTPLSIVLGLVAGLIGKKIFEQAWGLIDDQEPPDAKHREINFTKLIFALIFEGAIFRLVKGLTDHGARRAFAGVTGAWPGEEAPEPE
jgi:Protein of unknown function (DUF4235)